MQRLLDIENLRTTFDIHVGKVQAVRGVNLHVDEGETVGVVGESGCGKSVSMLSVLHLLPDYAKISADKMIFDGTDLTRLTPKMFRKISGDQIGMIFQDPMTSLNPLFTVGDQLIEPLRIHKGISKKEARDLVLEKLRMVEIPDPESRMKQYPHELSGGMRQRIMIAMAIMCNPRLIIADEPTTALDVTIQAQILDLLQSLQKKARHSRHYDYPRPRRHRGHVFARAGHVRRRRRGGRHSSRDLLRAEASLHVGAAALHPAEIRRKAQADSDSGLAARPDCAAAGLSVRGALSVCHEHLQQRPAGDDPAFADALRALPAAG